jgi:hypothetical protein
LEQPHPELRTATHSNGQTIDDAKLRVVITHPFEFDNGGLQSGNFPLRPATKYHEKGSVGKSGTTGQADTFFMEIGRTWDEAGRGRLKRRPRNPSIRSW